MFTLIFRSICVVMLSLSFAYSARTDGTAYVEIQKPTSLSDFEAGDFVMGEKENNVGYLIMNSNCNTANKEACKTVKDSVKFQLKGVESSLIRMQFKNTVLDDKNQSKTLNQGNGYMVLDSSGRGNLYIGMDLELTPKQKEEGVTLEVIASY